MRTIEISGGGPAGAAAALAALMEGATVLVYEKSAFPRHKVCGEFLSPEIVQVLEKLRVADGFLALHPSRLSTVRLHFGRRTKSWKMAEPAYGLSRYAFDHLLLSAAADRGADVRREPAPSTFAGPHVAAFGRKVAAEKGRRLFGFKAHFNGSYDDGVDLVFFDRCYAGVSQVEGGEINICGLAPELLLRQHGFDPASLLGTSPVLRDAMRGLERNMDWLVTGPLVFRQGFDASTAAAYLAGDALGFIDPFTGSGILAAVLTGSLAGQAAAQGVDPAKHLRNCRAALGFQYRTAGLFRAVLQSGWASVLAPLIPGRALFELTRPRV
jgi:hypothetical protein